MSDISDPVHQTNGQERWQRCLTDEIGLAKALKEGQKLTKTTSLFEILDNSNKAMKDNKEKIIEIIDTNDIFSVIDNGTGFKIEDAIDIMTQYKRSDLNGNTLSHYGIGLKSTLHHKLSRNSSGFMVSSTKSVDGDTYCVFSISLDENDCLQISNPQNPPEKWTKKVIHPIIPSDETGTLLFISNNISNLPTELKRIEYLCSQFQSWNKDENINDSENEITQDELSKMWSPLIDNGLSIKYNGINCKPCPFIQMKDILVFDTDIYINVDNRFHTLIIPEYDVQYIETSISTSDEQPKSKEGTRLGRLKFYVAEEGHESLKRIQYSFEGDRILQRNRFNKAHGHSLYTHLTMRAECIFSDIDYVKKELLEAKKTPDDMLNVESSLGRMKFINSSITRFCINETFLKKHNYYCKSPATEHTQGEKPIHNPRTRGFTKTQQRKIRDNNNSCCGICKIKLDDNILRIEYDHIIPFSNDGPTDVDNGQPLCVNCHERKTHGNIDDLSEEDRINYLKHIIEVASDALSIE